MLTGTARSPQARAGAGCAGEWLLVLAAAVMVADGVSCLDEDLLGSSLAILEEAIAGQAVPSQ